MAVARPARWPPGGPAASRGPHAAAAQTGARLFAERLNVPFIKAGTGLGNAPMAAAFHRAGRVTTGHQIDMTWDAPAGPPG